MKEYITDMDRVGSLSQEIAANDLQTDPENRLHPDPNSAHLLSLSPPTI